MWWRRAIWGIVFSLLLCLPAHAFNEGHFNNLLETGQYEQAVQYAKSYIIEEYRLTQNNRHIDLCLAYALWGKGEVALTHCQQVSTRPEWDFYLDCALDFARPRMGGPPRKAECIGDRGLNFSPNAVLYLKFAEAIAYYRLGNLQEASRSISIALKIEKSPSWFFLLPAAIIEGKDPSAIQVPEHDRQAFNNLRRDLTYGVPDTPVAQAARDTRIFYTEHPVGRASPYLAVAAFLSAGLIYVARRPLWRGVVGVAAASRTALIHAREKRQARAQKKVEEPPAPVTAAIPARPPYYDWRYPNQAYKVASYFNGFFWLLIAAPLVILAAIPAYTVLMNFSPSGLAAAVVNAKSFAFSFPDWGRPWFALVLLTLTGFVILKIFGRYSLPKPMRPKVRVFHTSVRLVLLAAFLGIVGTGLVFISSTLGSIANNRLVQIIADWF